MGDTIRIGTRESQLAVWQATQVRELLLRSGHQTELVYIKSEGDINLSTPLYEMGVQGIFTKALDMALLDNRIDIAVHSMKDVPVVLAKGLAQAAVLKRASYKDLLVLRGEGTFLDKDFKPGEPNPELIIATSSIRRKAQWLYRYPGSSIENLRGNVNTRLKKLADSNWQGAIFAAAGLERIGLRPANSIDLDWMLPAPAQGAIMVACRKEDKDVQNACGPLNDEETALCVKVERDFLNILQGGCSTPVSGLAVMKGTAILFKGNITATDGSESIDVVIEADKHAYATIAQEAANEVMARGANKYIQH